jgi:ABC-2 type transport system ATP-binding protein
VLLSSHLLADLERACDYLIVLQTARVQLVGAVEDLLAQHRTLVGPRDDTGTPRGVASVVRARHTDRQSTLLVRRDDDSVIDPAWIEHDVTLEDLVLAYLAEADTRTARTAWEVTA